MKRYRVTIHYLNGTIETIEGTHRYCATVRNRAFRWGHGWYDIEPV